MELADKLHITLEPVIDAGCGVGLMLLVHARDKNHLYLLSWGELLAGI